MNVLSVYLCKYRYIKYGYVYKVDPVMHINSWPVDTGIWPHSPCREKGIMSNRLQELHFELVLYAPRLRQLKRKFLPIYINICIYIYLLLKC